LERLASIGREADFPDQGIVKAFGPASLPDKRARGLQIALARDRQNSHLRDEHLESWRDLPVSDCW
jgi:hypothetical protein